MKRSDDVFFFTLIDFLVQVFFFGLVLYVLAQATHEGAEDEKRKSKEQIEKILKATGVSSLTELTDELTNLAPIKELKGMADFIGHSGGMVEVKKANEIARQAGGADNLSAALVRLKKLEEGLGKPPCLYEVVNGKKIVKPVGTVIATDTSITFQGTNAELEEVMRLVGTSYEAAKDLPLREFAKTFAPLVQKKSDCRYTLQFLENTRLVDARDAARFVFYLNIGKSH